MKKIIIALTLSLSLSVFANGVKEKPYYGEAIKADSAIVLDTVLKDFSKFEGKDIVMEANVKSVCEKKGCWMQLQGSKKTFRVKFHDYSFFVPMSLRNKKVWVEGEVKREKISVSDTKHYLEDAGASKEENAAVKKPTYEYSIIAKGVRIVK